jgi:hypothetical protein
MVLPAGKLTPNEKTILGLPLFRHKTFFSTICFAVLAVKPVKLASSFLSRFNKEMDTGMLNAYSSMVAFLY